ncbi:hypothetical protein [Pseudoalteromonas sp. S3785]|uniref:hypothetical protein n=1 Tax=Pseudoalteromonas sp. S3785 TaxID=579545 RepID=UPI00201D8B16|nr:hypothetical protein [Pseudoalteromonas sp. S3785]
MRILISGISLILLSFISSAQQLADDDSLPLLPAITLKMADGSTNQTQDLLGQT